MAQPHLIPAKTLTGPDLNTVVAQHTEMLSELRKLMASLDRGDVKSLKRVRAKLSAGLQALRAEPETDTTDVDAAPFVTKYRIQVLGESKVCFTLPKGASVLDLLNDAQALSGELYGRNAVYRPHLVSWSRDRAFKLKMDEPQQFLIDGNVADSTGKTRKAQEKFLKKQKPELEMPELRHLAAGHAAFFLATGKDLFGGKVVRARGGVLGSDVEGVRSVACYDGIRSSLVVAAAALPSRNKRI